VPFKEAFQDVLAKWSLSQIRQRIRRGKCGRVGFFGLLAGGGFWEKTANVGNAGNAGNAGDDLCAG
jgi:hypothetical protein